jgi:phosphatidylglycerophosphate synthase
MFDEPFRVRFQPVAQPLVRALAKAGATANQITIAAFVLALVAAVLVAAGHPWVGVGVWLLGRVLDGLDGQLARTTGEATAFGGFLDITLDMSAYSAMVIGFAALHPQYGLAWALVLAGYVVAITTTLALSDAAGTLGRQVGGSDRTFQFTPAVAEAGETSVMYVVWAMWPQHLRWWLGAWIVALLVTGVQRIVLARRTLGPAGGAVG